MIIHIEPWLAELKQLRAEFEEACKSNDPFPIERALYFSAILMRKLSETPFAAQDFLTKSIDVQIYKPNAGFVDGLNWLDAESHFDFSHGEPTRISFLDICNTLIHSLFLNRRPSSGLVEELLIAGGMRNRTGAIGFSPSQFVAILQYVEDYPYKNFPLPTARRAS